MNRIEDLNAFVRTSWNLLYKAAFLRKGAMQQGVIGTIGLEGEVQQRVVITREVDVANRSLVFFTDARSSKVQHLHRKPEVSWLFWDPKKHLQLRLQSTVSFHCGGASAKSYWEKLPVEARKNYASQLPPSTPISEYSDGLSADWKSDMNLEGTEAFFKHFMVVKCIVWEMQCLLLHRDGHQHARFDWRTKEMVAQWLIP